MTPDLARQILEADRNSPRPLMTDAQREQLGRIAFGELGAEQSAPVDVAASEPARDEAATPAAVKVHPGLAAAALQHRAALPYGLWLLARSLDGDRSDARGDGRITYDALRDATVSMGWSYDKFRRAFNLACELEMFIRANGAVYIRGLLTVARMLGAESVGALPVAVPTDALSKVATWHDALLASFHAGRRVEPLPITTRTVKALTGVPVRTQYDRVRRADVTVIKNYCETDAPASTHDLNNIRETVNAGAFAGKSGNIVWQMGNTYVVSESRYVRLKRGNTRKVNHRLRAGLIVSAVGQQPKPARTYHETGKSAYRTIKAANKGQRTMPDVLYILKDVTKAHDGRPLFATWRTAWQVV